MAKERGEDLPKDRKQQDPGAGKNFSVIKRRLKWLKCCERQ